MDIKVLNKEGNETGRTVSLSEEIFASQPNDHAIYLDVKLYMANQRQGTHKTKDKSEVHRSTRKILRQKGTGGARHGSLKAGTYVGGGRMHGPRPRDYSFKLNKKLRKLARISALSYKGINSGIMVLENFEMNSPKTKEFNTMLQNLKITHGNILFVTNGVNKNLVLSGRNIPGSRIMNVNDLNTYEIMKAKKLVLMEDSVETINNLNN